MNEKIFREYDIRGLADTDLSNAVMIPLSRACGTFFRKRGAARIALGYDCRASSQRIIEVLTEGLRLSGLDVTDIGLCPTPLLYFATATLNVDGGVMVTGSHNPAEYNGLKICLGHSTIHSHEIQEIKHILLGGHFEVGSGKKTLVDVKEAYLDHLTRNIQRPLHLTVVTDSGNGTAGILAPELYRRLGCKVHELFSQPDGKFPNHHPDPTVAENLNELIISVKKTSAAVGVGFDGDADRIGVVDPSGRVIYGDELLVLYSRDILKKKPGAKIISEVKASNRLFDDIRAHGGVPILWKTGHSLIKSKMKEVGAVLAGEMSGHMFFNDRYFGFDDAIYAGGRLLEILANESRSPAAMLSDLSPSFVTPEIRVDCSDQIKFEVVRKVQERVKSLGLKVNDIDGARLDFGDGWGLVRASNTQPALVYRFEAVSEQRLAEIRLLVEDLVNTAKQSVG